MAHLAVFRIFRHIGLIQLVASWCFRQSAKALTLRYSTSAMEIPFSTNRKKQMGGFSMAMLDYRKGTGEVLVEVFIPFSPGCCWMKMIHCNVWLPCFNWFFCARSLVFFRARWWWMTSPLRHDINVELTVGIYVPKAQIMSTPRKTNMSPENQWLEDVFPIEIVPFQKTC